MLKQPLQSARMLIRAHPSITLWTLRAITSTKDRAGQIIRGDLWVHDDSNISDRLHLGEGTQTGIIYKQPATKLPPRDLKPSHSPTRNAGSTTNAKQGFRTSAESQDREHSVGLTSVWPHLWLVSYDANKTTG